LWSKVSITAFLSAFEAEHQVVTCWSSSKFWDLELSKRRSNEDRMEAASDETLSALVMNPLLALHAPAKTSIAVMRTMAQPNLCFE
jgi:hypothetical protein